MGHRKNNFLVYAVIFIVSILVALYYAPYLVHHPDFTRGFTSCLLLFLVGFLLVTITNKLSIIDKTRFSFKWILVLTVIAALSLLCISVLGIFQHNHKVNENKIEILSLADNQAACATRNSSLISLHDHVLRDIETTLKNNPQRNLSNETIDQIALLSHSYEPYSMAVDTLLEYKISPERGQLLLSLIHFNFDSITFSKIKSQATFEYADLKDSQLQGVNLSGINLNYANLKDADLTKANLSNSKMNSINLSGAILKATTLEFSNLKNANLQWANLNDAILSSTTLNGANLSNAQLDKSKLKGSRFKYAQLHSANLVGADLEEVDLFGAQLKKVNCTDCNLSKANLRNSVWTDAYLTNANLSAAVLRGTTLIRTDLSKADLQKVFVQGENWFENLVQWQTIGVDDISGKYTLVSEKSFPSNYVITPIQ